jgi:excisionase family DNA binding protein
MRKVNEYLTIADAARFVGVSQNTLRLWAESGKVPVRRNPANGYRLFRKKDLEAFLVRLEPAASPKRKAKR